MCGIVGYIGKREAYAVLIKGLERLEYRGYDSAGVALLDKGIFSVYKNINHLKKFATFYFNLCFRQVMMDQSKSPFSAKYFILSNAQIASSKTSFQA